MRMRYPRQFPSLPGRLLAAVLIAAAAWAADPGWIYAQPAGDPATVVKQAIESRFPGSHVLKVQPSAIPGLYEVFTGAEIVYADAHGDYLVMGPMLDSQTHENLTEARLNDLGRIDFKTLPLDKAIKVVKGNGSRPFAVFSDPDCPFCQELEKNLLPATDFTMYVFLYPIASLHPQAPAKAHAIWCAKDRAAAWSQWMHEKKLPPAAASCSGDPIDQLQQLGDRMRINSTPTLFFANGRRVAGAIPLKDIELHLAGGPAESKAKPAASAGVAAPAPVAPASQVAPTPQAATAPRGAPTPAAPPRQ